MSRGARAYRCLLALLPRSFRDEYGDEMCRVAREQWEALQPRPGAWGAARFWARQSAALLRAAARLHSHEHGKRRGMTMEAFAHDLRHAARTLRRRPAFTLITVLTLGLGIGATTAIFSAVNTVLLRPLPYVDADRVMVLFRTDARTGERSEGVGATNIRDLRDQATLFDAVAVAEPWSLDMQVDDRTESLRAWSVTEGFFEAAGGVAQLGRTLTDADWGDDASVAVLGHRAWMNRFGGDPGVVGRDVVFDGQARTIVGVMPATFRLPDAAEVWVPRPVRPWDAGARAADYMTGLVRLRDGVSLEQASAEIARIAAGLEANYPDANRDLAYDLVPLLDHLLGEVRTPLTVLMAAVALVLLIACANVAGLMLARGAQRERDFALRGALGAGTGRLVGAVAAEGALLAMLGCGLGVLLAWGGVQAIGALAPAGLPRIDELAVDVPVLLFAVGVAAASAAVAALVPSLRLSRPDLRGALGDGARGTTGGRSAGNARSRLVVVQVASAVVLLTGAGLLMRSFGVLISKELGFDPSERLVVQIFAYDYETTRDAATVALNARDAMAALPGVQGVAIASDIPGSTDGAIARIDVWVPFLVEDRVPPPAGQEPSVALTRATPDYFDVLGIELARGRTFVDADDGTATPVAVVNEAFARRHLGDTEAIGQRLVLGEDRSSPAREIVGVVADVRPLGHASEPRPEVYVPLHQSWTGSLTYIVRATTDAAQLTTPAMEAIWEQNPAQSVYGSTTMDALLDGWLESRRFNLVLLAAFSVVALVLAAVGIYGLISFSVERRRGELGIRRALGGRSGDLLGMVLGEGVRLAVVGLVLGLAAAWYLTRFIQGMLVEVRPTDPVTFVGLGVAVLAVAAVASLLPALRAVRIDPVEALRSE